MSAIFNAQFWFFVAVTAGTFTIFGLGLQLQFGYAGLLNFGHVAFMAIGSYTMAILVVKAGMKGSRHHRLPPSRAVSSWGFPRSVSGPTTWP